LIPNLRYEAEIDYLEIIAKDAGFDGIFTRKYIKL